MNHLSNCSFFLEDKAKIMEDIRPLFDGDEVLGGDTGGVVILLMEEILNHLGCIKPCK